MAEVFKVQYSGKRFGKSMLMAQELAAKTRNFTSIDIKVMPHEDFDKSLELIAALLDNYPGTSPQPGSLWEEIVNESEEFYRKHKGDR